MLVQPSPVCCIRGVEVDHVSVVTVTANVVHLQAHGSEWEVREGSVVQDCLITGFINVACSSVTVNGNYSDAVWMKKYDHIFTIVISSLFQKYIRLVIMKQLGYIKNGIVRLSKNTFIYRILDHPV